MRHELLTSLHILAVFAVALILQALEACTRTSNLINWEGGMKIAGITLMEQLGL